MCFQPFVYQSLIPLRKCLDPHNIRLVDLKHNGTGICPPVNFYPPSSPSIFMDHSHEILLQQEAQFLLQAGDIEEILLCLRGKGFDFCYFLIPKTKGSFRSVLDLRQLNKFLKKIKFCMVALASISPSLKQRNCYAALVLKDTYFHVSICHNNRKCHQFCFQGGLKPGSLTDAFFLSWKNPLWHSFPLIPLLPRVLSKDKQDHACLILIAPVWPCQQWYSTLIINPLLSHPFDPDVIYQGHDCLLHPSLRALHLTVWILHG